MTRHVVQASADWCVASGFGALASAEGVDLGSVLWAELELESRRFHARQVIAKTVT